MSLESRTAVVDDEAVGRTRLLLVLIRLCCCCGCCRMARLVVDGESHALTMYPPLKDDTSREEYRVVQTFIVSKRGLSSGTIVEVDCKLTCCYE